MRCSRKGRCDGHALPAEDAGTGLKNDWVTWLFIVLTIAAGVVVGNWFNNLFK